MSLREGHILQLRVDSSLVDGFVSLIFDLLLLTICSFASQVICSHSNLRTVYDRQQPLSLHTAHVLYFGHGLIGPARISRILCWLLSICTICVIVLGFSIRGRSDNTFTPEVHRSVISIDSPPQLAQFDYEREFEVEDGQSAVRPNLISRRLIGLSTLDRCQSCAYTHCTYLGYGFIHEQLDSELVPSWETIDRWSDDGAVRCITADEFRQDIVSWRYKIEKTHADLKCDLDVIKVAPEGTFMKGEPVGKCDLAIEDVRCFRRPSQGGPAVPVHCAAVGKASGSNRMQLILFRDSEHIDHPEVTPFSMSIHNSFSSDQVKHYLKNVAFFSSLDLGPAYKLDLMAFGSVTFDKTLQRRTKEIVNVTELDLRIAIPCMVILSVTAIILCTVAVTSWYSTIYCRKRRNLNTFSTVSDILELLLPEYEVLDSSRSSRPNKNIPPTIGILDTSQELGVRRSLEDFMQPGVTT